MFQQLCENSPKLGSDGDIAQTRPILKELQAVLQRWDTVIFLYSNIQSKAEMQQGADFVWPCMNEKNHDLFTMKYSW